MWSSTQPRSSRSPATTTSHRFARVFRTSGARCRRSVERTPHAHSRMSDFDRIADELYAGRPDAFAAARDAAIKQARADKDTTLAKELGALRRPTQSAWLINL